MKKRLFTSLLFILTLTLTCAQRIECWNRFETSFKYATNLNGFTAVQLSATFTCCDTSVTVSGFYDGSDTFKIRFMPMRTGHWTYRTKSNCSALNNIKGNFECIPASAPNHGPVKVSGTYNFCYADGTPYYPFGTTAYAWTHMPDDVQEQTLKTLASSAFNKLRMCVFPKNYNLVKEEPTLYPFEIKATKENRTGKEQKVWDFNRFNPAFFQQLEKRIDNLNQLGIEADLILFHPYDKGRWGFDAMPKETNLRYLRYLIARLGSFRNVWWSMANEYDYVAAKTDADWELLSKTVHDTDPYKHLCSIHGSTAKYFRYWEPWFTHVSIQDEAPVADFGRAAILRNVYYKPIVYDEVCYEGNLKNRWGRYSAEEMTHAIWQGVIAGTYVTHGECYMLKDANDTLFWAKGGQFKGESWKRVAFLRRLIEAAPGPFELADLSRDHCTSTNGKGTYLIYFGKAINDSWLFNLPVKNAAYDKLKAGTKYRVEIIDTWDMTVTPCNTIFETAPENDYRMYDNELRKIRLPAKPYMALRITEIK